MAGGEAEAALLREQKSKIVPNTEQNVTVCTRFCGTCPTHETCGKSEYLFCSTGVSDNRGRVVQQGCNCPECEIWMKYGLSEMYFCVHGEA